MPFIVSPYKVFVLASDKHFILNSSSKIFLIQSAKPSEEPQRKNSLATFNVESKVLGCFSAL